MRRSALFSLSPPLSFRPAHPLTPELVQNHNRQWLSKNQFLLMDQEQWNVAYSCMRRGNHSPWRPLHPSLVQLQRWKKATLLPSWTVVTISPEIPLFLIRLQDLSLSTKTCFLGLSKLKVFLGLWSWPSESCGAQCLRWLWCDQSSSAE